MKNYTDDARARAFAEQRRLAQQDAIDLAGGSALDGNKIMGTCGTCAGLIDVTDVPNGTQVTCPHCSQQSTWYADAPPNAAHSVPEDVSDSDKVREERRRALNELSSRNSDGSDASVWGPFLEARRRRGTIL